MVGREAHHSSQIGGKSHGPAFATPYGKLAMSVDYNSQFWQYLKLVQENANLILENQEVEMHFPTKRSHRKLL
jgi:tyrosine-protein phosphatase YwqE